MTTGRNIILITVPYMKMKIMNGRKKSSWKSHATDGRGYEHGHEHRDGDGDADMEGEGNGR